MQTHSPKLFASRSDTHTALLTCFLQRSIIAVQKINNCSHQHSIQDKVLWRSPGLKPLPEPPQEPFPPLHPGVAKVV